MSSKKAFVFDLDGTYLSNEHDALPESVEAIKLIKEKGHIPIIATGRPLQDIVDVITGYELFDYYICNNGTYAVKNGDLNHKFLNMLFQLKLQENLWN